MSFFNKVKSDISIKAHDSIRKAAIYFPKTILIGTIINVALNIFRGSLAGYASIVLNYFLIRPHINHIFASIDLYEKNGFPELSTPIATKKKLLNQINRTVKIKQLFSFFQIYISNIYFNYKINRTLKFCRSLIRIF